MAEQLTEEQFQTKVMGASEPVLVDFFATVGGTVDRVLDREIELAQHYNVMSVPTLIIFKGGQPVQQFVGVQPKQVLVNALS